MADSTNDIPTGAAVPGADGGPDADLVAGEFVQRGDIPSNPVEPADGKPFGIFDNQRAQQAAEFAGSGTTPPSDTSSTSSSTSTSSDTSTSGTSSTSDTTSGTTSGTTDTTSSSTS